MATAQSPNDLTRQQLDELDALLQRMLALPLNPPETPAATRPTLNELPLPEMPNRAASGTPYTPTISAQPTVLTNREVHSPTIYRGESTAPVGPQLLAVAAPSVPAIADNPRPAPPSRTNSTSNSNGLAHQTIEEALSAFVKPREKLESPPSSTANTPLAAKQNDAVPALLSPLVSFNRLLNLGLDRLGLLGRLLQTGLVRNLFALVGFFLLALTATRVIELEGWATLPVSFPWRK